MTPDQLDSRKLWWWTAVFVVLSIIMGLLGPGCTGNGERYQRKANQIAAAQNKSPPDPKVVAEIREVLEWLCDKCKRGEYMRGWNDGIDYQKQKGSETK